MPNFDLEVGMTVQPCCHVECDTALPLPPDDAKVPTESSSTRRAKRNLICQRQQDQLRAFLDDFQFKDINSWRSFNQERLYPIHLASMMGDEGIIRLLKSFGADLQKKSSKGRSAVDLAKVALSVRMDDKGFENSAAYVRYHHVIELLEVKTISMRQFLVPEEVAQEQEVKKAYDRKPSWGAGMLGMIPTIMQLAR